MKCQWFTCFCHSEVTSTLHDPLQISIQCLSLWLKALGSFPPFSPSSDKEIHHNIVCIHIYMKKKSFYFFINYKSAVPKNMMKFILNMQELTREFKLGKILCAEVLFFFFFLMKIEIIDHSVSRTRPTIAVSRDEVGHEPRNGGSLFRLEKFPGGNSKALMLAQ